MKKKFLLLLILAVIISGAAFAQNIWITGYAGFLGGGMDIDVMLFRELSIGFNGFYNILFDTEFWGGSITIKFFPVDFLFVGMGFGYLGSFDYNFINYNDYDVLEGIGLTPEVGVRFDPGKKGSFFIHAGLKLPILFGTKQVRNYVYNYGYSSGGYYNYEEVSETRFGFVPYAGIGFAF